MTAVEQQQVDYTRIRSLVKAAFTSGGSPYRESPMADHITTDKRAEDLSRARAQYPSQPWNTVVHARETRRPGRSKELIDRRDWELESVCRRIERLSGQNRAILSYFYHANSIVGKHPAKQAIWAVYLDRLDGCKADTKTTILMMLDRLLPRYRILLLQHVEDYPEKPWKLFPKDATGRDEDMTEKSWYRTFRPHWLALREQIILMDEGILDEIR